MENIKKIHTCKEHMADDDVFVMVKVGKLGHLQLPAAKHLWSIALPHCIPVSQYQKTIEQ